MVLSCSVRIRYLWMDSERSEPGTAYVPPHESLGSSVPYRTMTKKTSPWMAVAARPRAPHITSIISCRLRLWNTTALTIQRRRLQLLLMR